MERMKYRFTTGAINLYKKSQYPFYVCSPANWEGCNVMEQTMICLECACSCYQDAVEVAIYFANEENKINQKFSNTMHSINYLLMHFPIIDRNEGKLILLNSEGLKVFEQEIKQTGNCLE